MDRIGAEGSPPRPPARHATGELFVEDPDADLARWELKVWLQPDERLQPAQVLRGPDTWQPDARRQRTSFQPVWGEDQTSVWYRSWAEDSRGHRADSGLVKLSLRSPAAQGPQAVRAPEWPVLPAATSSPGPDFPARGAPVGQFGRYGWAVLLAVAAGLMVSLLPWWSERE